MIPAYSRNGFPGGRKVDVALLPMVTCPMGPEDAVKAAEMIAPEYVIPMHYNTFPVIKQDPEEFKKAVEEKGICKVKVLNPGQTLEL